MTSLPRPGPAGPGPDKREIVRRLREVLASRFERLRSSQRDTREGATHPESRQEHPKDTRAIEAGYLARGLAERVETLHEAIVALGRMEPRDFGADEPAGVGALVEVERAGARLLYFLAPAGGGETIGLDGCEVLVVTPASPVGEALVGTVRGDELELRGPRTTVLRVS